MSKMSSLAIEIQNGDRIVTNEYYARVKVRENSVVRYFGVYAWGSCMNEAYEVVRQEFLGQNYYIVNMFLSKRGVRI
jgi:hypothetical protein